MANVSGRGWGRGGGLANVAAVIQLFSRVTNDKIQGIQWPAVASVRRARREVVVINDSSVLGVWLDGWTEWKKQSD